MNRLSSWITFTIVLITLLCAAEVRAARLVKLEVEQDGNVILQGIATDTGSEDRNFVWLYFHSTELAPEGEFVMPALAGQPPEALLEGKIKIRATHAGRTLAETATDSLIMRPFPNKPPGTWQVAPNEVTRTGKLAGITFPSGEAMTGPGIAITGLLSHPLGIVMVVGIVLLVVVLVLGSLMLLSRKKMP